MKGRRSKILHVADDPRRGKMNGLIVTGGGLCPTIVSSCYKNPQIVMVEKDG